MDTVVYSTECFHVCFFAVFAGDAAQERVAPGLGCIITKVRVLPSQNGP